MVSQAKRCVAYSVFLSQEMKVKRVELRLRAPPFIHGGKNRGSDRQEQSQDRNEHAQRIWHTHSDDESTMDGCISPKTRRALADSSA